MIQTKDDLQEFLKRDRLALYKHSKPKLFGDYVYKFEIALRMCEYYKNTNKKSLLQLYYKYKYKKLSKELGFTIPLNVFDKGLSIAHYGTIVIHPGAVIGENCRIHEGVTIGATNGFAKAAKIGRNAFIASGAKIIGDITIADDVAIGANAVVVKDIMECGTTWAGVPAKKISDHDSHLNINPELFEDIKK